MKTYKIVKKEIEGRYASKSEILHSGLSLAEASSFLLEYYNRSCYTSFDNWEAAVKNDDMEKIFENKGMYGYSHSNIAYYIKEEQ